MAMNKSLMVIAKSLQKQFRQKSRILYVLLLTLTALPVLPQQALADLRGLNLRDCNNQEALDIREATSILQQFEKSLKEDFEFDGRLPRADTRVKRRLDRLIDDMRITCNRPFRCRDGVYGRGFALGPRIHICYDNLIQNREGLCRLTSTIAHEFGHWIGMTAKVGHNDGFPQAFDPVMRFGFFAEDLCRQSGLERPLPLPAGTRISVPACNTVPRTGVLVFSQKQFRGCPRHFSGTSRESADLRIVGRDSSISSVRVVGGAWESCLGRNFTDWCHTLAGDIDNLEVLEINNKIESLRSFPGHTSGLIVFRGENFQGGHQNFTASVPNLKTVGINDKISSLRVLSGQWEVCTKTDFAGQCMTVRPGDNLNLRGTGLNDKITSIRFLR